jgi:L-ascorbate metabolism protein UlaG (beta-lactamase superfamily)
VTRSRKKNALTQLAHHLRRKTASLRNGGGDAQDEHRVGLVPSKGWGRRNFEFFHKVLIPSALKRRGGREQRFDTTAVPAGKARVFWIGHASFLVQMAGKNILIDPNWAMWLSIVKRARRPGLALHELPVIDLVLITHAHHDHLDVPTLEMISDGQPIVVPHGVGSLVRRRGFGKIQEVRKWDTLDFGDFEITFTPARHWGARFVHDVHRGFGGYLLRPREGTVVYHSGDSAYFDGFHEIGRRFEIDVALLPIGAYLPVSGRGVHMTPEEALAAFNDLRGKKMVPMHYRTFPLTREPLDEPLQRLLLASSAHGMRHKVAVLEEGAPAVF